MLLSRLNPRIEVIWRIHIRPAAKVAFLELMSHLPLGIRRRIYFLTKHRRFLRLSQPRSFSEKVNWRMVNDRRAIIGQTCDKLRSKTFAAERAVDTVQTFWSGTDLTELKHLKLPQHWVLKPNHRSGLVYLGTGAPDVDRLSSLTAGWLGEQLWSTAGEWAYSQADRCLILEQRLGNPGEDLPDYKFFVFSGRVELIQVDTERMVNHKRRLYSRDWEPYNVRLNYPIGPTGARPKNLDVMIETAQRLGSDFDFVRVDLYDFDDKIWFGELTPYPGGGGERFVPYFLDEVLGRTWQLPNLHS